MQVRGTFNFEVNSSGDIVNSAANAELLRKLWLDSRIILPGGPGPGNFGDFDNGAWHVSCHLAAAGCVKRAVSGSLMWLEISHDDVNDLYYPSLTTKENNNIKIFDLSSLQAKNLLKDSVLLGFIEGNSEGRISAKGIRDNFERFNKWRRQDYNKRPGDPNDGGKVWEHWCTTRDIRSSSQIGSSVITAFISLIAESGDKFIPTVARGRRDYQHPNHLRAMVKAGLTSKISARWNISPTAIPETISLKLQEASPKISLEAAEKLDWGTEPKYYMFKRRIGRWNNNDLP